MSDWKITNLTTEDQKKFKECLQQLISNEQEKANLAEHTKDILKRMEEDFGAKPSVVRKAVSISLKGNDIEFKETTEEVLEILNIF